ncbi:transposase [Holdemania sp. Marseille-P2844]|uniref:IS66 family transposase n=1 Tax=Holdemania sp. Marseille-P2844 TaxID=1852366 RepID=UPI001114C6B9
MNYLIFDETTPTSLEDKAQGERQKSYTRVNISRKWEAKPFSIYFYNKRCAETMANEILMEYAGSLHCDSYPVYSRIEKATILD